MADTDANKEALDQVENATESEPVEGADLLKSPELKRQLREAKERIKSGEATLPKDNREDRRS